MAAEARLHKREGDHWWRGLGTLLERENRLWWGSRRWWVQLLVWVGLLDGLLAFALFVLPNMAAADGVAITTQEALEVGQQMFFGLGLLASAVGAIVILQDAIIDEKASGTAAWVLSKPVSRPAYILAKLLPNLLAITVVMLLVPGVIGYLLFRAFDPEAITWQGFLLSEAIVALNLCFYVGLTLLLGVLFSARPPLLAIALGSLLGGSLVPVAAIVQFTPWKLADMALLPVMGQPLPPIAFTMIASTALWAMIFVLVAVWRFGRQEF